MQASNPVNNFSHLAHPGDARRHASDYAIIRGQRVAVTNKGPYSATVNGERVITDRGALYFGKHLGAFARWEKKWGPNGTRLGSYGTKKPAQKITADSLGLSS